MVLDVAWFHDQLREWEFTGFETEKLGLWGTEISDPMMKFVHGLFPPAPDDVLDQFVLPDGAKLPAAYREQLRVSNGVVLFRRDLELFGTHHKGYQCNKGLMPFDIFSHNIDFFSHCQRLGGALIGAFDDEDGLLWLLMHGDGSVFAADEDWQATDLDWPDLDHLVADCAEKLATSEKWQGVLARFRDEFGV